MTVLTLLASRKNRFVTGLLPVQVAFCCVGVLRINIISIGKKVLKIGHFLLIDYIKSPWNMREYKMIFEKMVFISFVHSLYFAGGNLVEAFEDQR
jgi:hypothetical protein